MPSRQHRNVLLIVADDLGLFLGCYGIHSISTPNIDKLAAKGIRFTHAFASTASCSGSRSTIYTGLHTHENGQYGLANGTYFNTHEHIDSAPLLFENSGFLTGIVGKVHVGPPTVYPWTVREGTKTEDRDVAFIADKSRAFFARAKDEHKPFFLTVGLHDPHRERSRGGFCNQHWPRVHDFEISPADVEVPAWINDVPEVRTELCEYYRAIHRCDQGVGMLMDALATERMEDDTLVIFLSDNGAPFVNAKTTMYDAGIKLPLIVSSPLHSNVVNPNLVSWIDILPTMLDWAGIRLDLKLNPLSPDRLGRSFLPILGSSTVEKTAQTHVFGSHTFHSLQNYYPTRYIRTRRYKYNRNVAWRLEFPFAADLYCTDSWNAIRNLPGPVRIGPRPLRDYIFRPAEQLFDLDTDPDEVVNIADKPELGEILKDLRAKLEAWQQETADVWLIRDGQTIRGLKSWIPNLELDIPDRFDFDVDDASTRGKLVSVNVLWTDTTLGTKGGGK